MSARGAWVAALLLSATATATACGGPGASEAPRSPNADRGAVAERPGPGANAASHEMAFRFPRGSAVVRVADGAETPLSAGLAAAGAASVAFDGERVLFAARESDDAPFAVFACAPDGGGRKAVAHAGGDCGAADTLPDGRIVYAASTGEPVERGPRDALRGWALFVAPGDGTEGARITWGGIDVDPCVLSDGRILFSTWRPGERGDAGGGRFVLVTVHPDGTGVAPFRIDEGSALRASQRASLDVDFVRVRDGAVSAAACSWDVPSREIAAAERTLRIAPRPRPQGHLSSVRADVAFATLVALDARGGTDARSVRVVSGDRAIGEAPLAEDGSFQVRVPVNRPLRLELLDGAGAVTARERGSFWLRPGETRVCVRCHDDAETGPPNVRAAALLGDPVDLASGTGGAR